MTTKNTTRIGDSLLGTWTSEVNVSSHDKSSLTAYMIVHFLADPRKAHGCELLDCQERDNQVCMLSAITDYGHTNIAKKCHDIAKEKDVSWSDLTVFYYFGVKINSPSKPKAHKELSTGAWVGPFNLIMAQDANDNNQTNNLVDRYVGRYVQSESMTPPFLQNMAPVQSTLYTKPDRYQDFLGTSALAYTTRVQANFTNSIGHEKEDPYSPYRETCDHGNMQPILPLLELDFYNNDNNNDTANDPIPTFRLKYKIMAVPTPAEAVSRILKPLQSKFQGNGGYNIIGGPYCYGDDPNRAYSFDLDFGSGNTTTLLEKNSNNKMTFVRGCIDGYPCHPPAAMGGVPLVRQTCDNHHHHHPDNPPNHGTGIPNMVLSFVCYGLTVALLISMTVHCHVSHREKQEKKRRRRQMKAEEGYLGDVIALSSGDGEDMIPPQDDPDQPVYFGAMNLLKGVGITAGAAETDHTVNHQNESVGPFGDLDGSGADRPSVDPLQEPLLGEDEPKEEAEPAATE